MGTLCCEKWDGCAKTRTVRVVGELATRLRELRERSGLKQKEMAAKLRDKGFAMSDAYWNQLENGNRRLDFDVVRAVAGILGLEMGRSAEDILILLSLPSQTDRASMVRMEIAEHQRRLEELRQEQERLAGNTGS